MLERMNRVLAEWRAAGVLSSVAVSKSPGFAEHEASREPLSLYMGVDPTADSLHAGHLAGVCLAGRLARATGWRPVFVVGGATARLGDPSMRTAEKEALAPGVLAANARALAAQLAAIAPRLYVPGAAPPALVLDNASWTAGVSVLDFLSGPCGRMRVAAMLGRECVARRLASREGLSLSELVYQALQAHDFAHLRAVHNVRLQVGGSDQRGNMVAGLDVMRRAVRAAPTPGDSHVSDARILFDSEGTGFDSGVISAEKGHSFTDRGHNAEISGLTQTAVAGSNLSDSGQMEAAVATFALLADTPGGEKMGKSAGNAVWLDPRRTTPYALHQYMLRRPDGVAGALAALVLDAPPTDPREVQRALADEVVRVAHGAEALAAVHAQAGALAGQEGSASQCPAQCVVEDASEAVRGGAGVVVRVPAGDGRRVIDVLSDALGESRRRVRAVAATGGVHSDGRALLPDDLLKPAASLAPVLVRVGKSRHVLIEAVKERC